MLKLTAAHIASQPEVAAQAARNPGKSAYLCRTILSTNNGEPFLEPGDIIWADDLTVTITPEQAARAVLATMDFHPIDLGISQKMSGPQGVGYVGVPVWMWAKGGATKIGPQHKSATYVGIAVSLDATMDKVVWNLGDGGRVTCGRGTPYRAEIGYADSPTCGHRYQRISKDQPGGAYRVSATSHWNVAWAAGGETGSVPLTFTTATSLEVGEIQVVVTRG